MLYRFNGWMFQCCAVQFAMTSAVLAAHLSGAINTVLSHGSDELKAKYLEKMVDGTWTGTMCLTEPQGGSDLNLVSTKAEPIGDGKYKINGTKIFISCGEHDMTENIIHCVLARLPDAPAGTRGISLFLVPKRKVADDGAVGELNGAKIGRIEEKMGCHGSSTCVIDFTDSEGYLIGTANKGLSHMFTFINTSRIGVSMQGMAAAEASYQNALWYAKERLAMRSLSGCHSPASLRRNVIGTFGAATLVFPGIAISPLSWHPSEELTNRWNKKTEMTCTHTSGLPHAQAASFVVHSPLLSEYFTLSLLSEHGHSCAVC